MSLTKRQLDELPDEEYSFWLGYRDWSDSLPESTEDELRACADNEQQQLA